VASASAPLRVLVTDNIDADGVAVLRAEPAFAVDELPTMPPAELLARIAGYDAFVGRSATKITRELLAAAPKLRVVGRAGVGVDNIAIDFATELGIAVINAPAGNTIAVAELFFGALLALIRDIPRADVSMHDGRWERDAKSGSVEVGGLGWDGETAGGRAGPVR